jgi:hypothetical protein
MHLTLPPSLLQEARPAWNPLGLRRSITTRSTRPYAQAGVVLPRVQAVAALSPGGCPSCNVLPQLWCVHPLGPAVMQILLQREALAWPPGPQRGALMVSCATVPRVHWPHSELDADTFGALLLSTPVIAQRLLPLLSCMPCARCWLCRHGIGRRWHLGPTALCCRSITPKETPPAHSRSGRSS